MRVAVVGLWHLGPVTAAAMGRQVAGGDPEADVIAELASGRLPVYELGGESS